MASATVAALATAGLVAVAAAPANAALPPTVASGSIEWGFKESFRNYVGGGMNTNPVGQKIVLTDPATFVGEGTAETRPYAFPVTSTRFDAATPALDSDGAVTYSFPAHYFTSTISDVRIGKVGEDFVVTADTATVATQQFGTVQPGTYEGDDTVIATIGDLAVTTDAEGAQLAGTDVTLTEAGAAVLPFYGAGAALDDISATLTLTDQVPTVTVEKTSFASDGSWQVTVRGSGFDPAAAIGSRSPLSGKEAGTYVAFGRFPTNWRPSAGVASSQRPNSNQKWAVPQESFATIGGAAAGAAILEPDGTFTVTLVVDKAAADAKSTAIVDGRYGIYTYAGSGAVTASYETYTPITFFDRADTQVFAADVEVASGVTPVVQAKVFASDLTTPSGDVVVEDGTGAALGTGTLVAGSAKVALDAALATGEHVVTVRYAGDDTRKPDSATATITVGAEPEPAGPAESEVVVFDGDAVVGTAVKLPVAVTAPGSTVAGTVSATVDGSTVVTGTLIAGRATLSLPELAVGSHAVQVEFTPADDSLAPSSSAATVTVVKGASSLDVTWPTVTHGTAASVAVAVTGPVPATGTVTLKNGSTVVSTATLGSGAATLTLPKTVAAGTRTLTVTYAGSTQLLGAATTAKVTVAKAKSATTLTLPTTVKPTAQAKAVVTVKATGVVPTGKVTVVVKQNGATKATVVATLSGGKATLTLPKLKAGTYQVVVTYGGSGDVTSSKATAKLRVA
ncbi:Ig-like domain repeat protein [Cellulomonas composti]|uniref:Bacterial Ig-like domain-containing protein n=1 Tax=Cellulomonas composti TaxID=266130 RepID=A0A511JCC0_9CELL|nr:Ig-like domain repeat protein [Cellulomonas composti]GEL95622.1 hypothetical protein CCO02nite_22800 [Cellulomonas composti]